MILPAGSCKSRMTDREVTLLPEPDSPTMPSTRPFCTVKLMPSTAGATPRSVKKLVRSSLTSNNVSPMVFPPVTLPRPQYPL